MVGGINPPPFNGGITPIRKLLLIIRKFSGYNLVGSCVVLGRFCKHDPFFLNVPSTVKKIFGKFMRN